MRRVVLAGTSIETSALGFGTAHFGRRLSRAEQGRLLEAAFDAGIMHFDTAPAYGLGLAERSLARFLSRRRDAVTVATKAGIEPRRAAVLRRAAGAPALRGGCFRPDEIRRSLERSLRRLGTDHVDLLLLHECPASAVDDGVLAVLDDLVRRGDVVATGTATSADATASLVVREAGFPSVIQVQHEHLADLPPGHGRATITHSAISRGIPLERALAENDGGIVLFSTSDLAHIPTL